MQLIIDAGNTSIKFVLIASGKIIETIVSSKSAIGKVNLVSLKKYGPKQAFLGSVVPSLNKKIIDQVKNQLGLKTHLIIAKDFSKKLDLKKFNLTTQGVDILALALYIANKHGSGIGVSFGTATFIVFVKKNQLIGTAILPGILTGVDILGTSTEMVSTSDFSHRIEKPYPNFYGTDTITALLAGAQILAIGSISAAKDLSKKIFFKDPQIIVSGGKAILLKLKDKNIKKVDNAVALGYYELKN